MIFTATDVFVDGEARTREGQGVHLPTGFDVLGVRVPVDGYLPRLTIYSTMYSATEDTGDRAPRLWRLYVTPLGCALPARHDWQGMVVLQKEPVMVSLLRCWS